MGGLWKCIVFEQFDEPTRQPVYTVNAFRILFFDKIKHSLCSGATVKIHTVVCETRTVRRSRRRKLWSSETLQSTYTRIRETKMKNHVHGTQKCMTPLCITFILCVDFSGELSVFLMSIRFNTNTCSDTFLSSSKTAMFTSRTTGHRETRTNRTYWHFQNENNRDRKLFENILRNHIVIYFAFIKHIDKRRAILIPREFELQIWLNVWNNSRTFNSSEPVSDDILNLVRPPLRLIFSDTRTKHCPWTTNIPCEMLYIVSDSRAGFL